MDQKTKDAIIQVVAKRLDEVDNAMSKVESRYAKLKKHTQEFSQSHVEELQEVRGKLENEFERLADASEETFESVMQQVDGYTDSFSSTYKKLLNSAKDNRNGHPGWLEVPPPTIGYANLWAAANAVPDALRDREKHAEGSPGKTNSSDEADERALSHSNS